MSSHEGWVKIHRKIIDSDIWTAEPFTKGQAWVDLILIANHKDKDIHIRGIFLTVKRGQTAVGIDTLARKWKWSRGKVERFILYLETVRQIVRQKSNVITLISIVNYDNYQSDEHQIVRQTVNQTIKQTVNQTEVNKNDNNVKNENNNKAENLKILEQDEFEIRKNQEPWFQIPSKHSWNIADMKNRLTQSPEFLKKSFDECSSIYPKISQDRFKGFIREFFKKVEAEDSEYIAGDLRKYFRNYILKQTSDLKIKYEKH